MHGSKFGVLTHSEASISFYSYTRLQKHGGRGGEGGKINFGAWPASSR